MALEIGLTDSIAFARQYLNDALSGVRLREHDGDAATFVAQQLDAALNEIESAVMLIPNLAIVLRDNDLPNVRRMSQSRGQ